MSVSVSVCIRTVPHDCRLGLARFRLRRPLHGPLHCGSDRCCCCSVQLDDHVVKVAWEGTNAAARRLDRGQSRASIMAAERMPPIVAVRGAAKWLQVQSTIHQHPLSFLPPSLSQVEMVACLCCSRNICRTSIWTLFLLWP